MSANEAVCFRLVHTAEDLEAAQEFNPEFTHQVFREDETIFGFKGLEIRIFLHGATFHALVEIQHQGQAPPQLGAPDNLEARLQEAFPAGFTTSRPQFLTQLAAMGPSPPPGDLVLQELPLRSPPPGARVLQLDGTRPGARALHRRLAPFVLFEIDAGQLVDVEADPRWEVLVVTSKSAGGHDAVAGFATASALRAPRPPGASPRIAPAPAA